MKSQLCNIPQKCEVARAARSNRTHGCSFHNPLNVAANDSVDLAGLNSIEQSVMHLPDIHYEKVHALREQVRSGSYHVDASKTAEAILSVACESNGAGQKQRTGPEKH